MTKHLNIYFISKSPLYSYNQNYKNNQIILYKISKRFYPRTPQIGNGSGLGTGAGGRIPTLPLVPPKLPPKGNNNEKNNNNNNNKQLQQQADAIEQKKQEMNTSHDKKPSVHQQSKSIREQYEKNHPQEIADGNKKSFWSDISISKIYNKCKQQFEDALIRNPQEKETPAKNSTSEFQPAADTVLIKDQAQETISNPFVTDMEGPHLSYPIISTEHTALNESTSYESKEAKRLDYEKNQDNFKLIRKQICDPIITNYDHYSKNLELFISSAEYTKFEKYMITQGRYNIPFDENEYRIIKLLDVYIQTKILQEENATPFKELKRCFIPKDYAKRIFNLEKNITFLKSNPDITFSDLELLGLEIDILRKDKNNIFYTFVSQLTQKSYDAIKNDPQKFNVEFINKKPAVDCIIDSIKTGQYFVVKDNNLYPNSVIHHSHAIHKTILVPQITSSGEVYFLKIAMFTSATDEGTILLSKTQETNIITKEQGKEQRFRIFTSYIFITNEQRNHMSNDNALKAYTERKDEAGQDVKEKIIKALEDSAQVWSNNYIQKPLTITKDVLYKIIIDQYKVKLDQATKELKQLTTYLEEGTEAQKAWKNQTLEAQRQAEQDMQKRNTNNALLQKQDKDVLKLKRVIEKIIKNQDKDKAEVDKKQARKDAEALSKQKKEQDIPESGTMSNKSN